MTAELQPGYSGCPIRLRAADPTAPNEAGVEYVVEKTSATLEYNVRLESQTTKLEAYGKAMAEHKHIRCPRVLFRKKNADGLLVIGMSFEPHTNSMEHLSTALVGELRVLTAVLINFMKSSVAASPLRQWEGSVFAAKMKRFKQDAEGNAVLGERLPATKQMFDGLVAFAESRTTHELPIGECHGDLTLSNMLVQSDSSGARRLVLIDFQDSYVESPLADMAKLCQDLVYGWTLRFLPDDVNVDTTRVYLIMAHMKREMEKAFAGELWYREYFQVFFAINQLRVLRYSQTEEDREYLYHSAATEYNKWITQPGNGAFGAPVPTA